MNQNEANHANPWWKEPYAWLVFGGPFIVVVAAIYTVFIAMDNPDPLVDRSAPRAGAAVGSAQSSGSGVMPNLQPANQARNHAASPLVPKSVPAEK